MKPRKPSMLLALERVITAEGLALNPGHNDTKAVYHAWELAKIKGYIRTVKSVEATALLDLKRATRAIILGMLNDAATDETRSSLWADRENRPSMMDCADALYGVCNDIERIVTRDSSFYWTLTLSGAALLADYSRTGEGEV